jgi:hypothetical protein
MALPPLIAAMLRPEFYPHRPAAVELVQTHISYVLLAGDQVYKVKKPVRFSFLDFSTLERRRHFCHEEVRLNRRLAPGVYRGVVAIVRDGETFRLAPDAAAAAVEYAVHMRRLPAGRTLDQLLEHDQVIPEMMDALAIRLADFHRAADASPAVTANGDPAAITRILEDNFANARRFRDVTIPAADDDAIQAFTRAFLRNHDALFRRRQVEQRIRDGHGDLHSEHICFDDGVVIYDCIEFNPAFRYCDVASDVAFLAMDLAYHDRPDLAERLVMRYAAHAGDGDLRRLVPFYACYRAYVRGKVDSLKSVEEEVVLPERAAASSSARRHFALAYRFTWAYRPCLVVLMGLSGTGKSAIAEALRVRTGLVHLNSDVIRKQLAGLAPTARAPSAGYEAGLYSPDMSARTYQTMFAAAAARLAEGHGVILDATFQLRQGRDTARGLAQQHRVPFLLIECRCSDDEVRRRLHQRAQRGTSESDADWNVFLEQRRRFEAFDSGEDADHLVVDTATPAERLAMDIEAALAARCSQEGST